MLALHLTATASAPGPQPSSDLLQAIGPAAWSTVDAIAPRPGQTILVVGVSCPLVAVAAQLIRLCGARVLIVADEQDRIVADTIGAEQVGSGDNLAQTIRAIAPAGVTGCLVGNHVTDLDEIGLALGITPDRFHHVTTQPQDIDANLVRGHLRQLAAHNQLALPTRI